MRRPELAGWETSPDEPLADHWINREWPWWRAWMGVTGLYYARRPRTSPPKVVRAATLAALGPQIERADRPQP